MFNKDQLFYTVKIEPSGNISRVRLPRCASKRCREILGGEFHETVASGSFSLLHNPESKEDANAFAEYLTQEPICGDALVVLRGFGENVPFRFMSKVLCDTVFEQLKLSIGKGVD